MDIATYRRSLGMTQEQFATLVGLKSRSHMSEIEKVNRCNPEAALKIEAHSERKVDAATINDTIAAARKGWLA